jgi:hypothetical protein
MYCLPHIHYRSAQGSGLERKSAIKRSQPSAAPTFERIPMQELPKAAIF